MNRKRAPKDEPTKEELENVAKSGLKYVVWMLNETAILTDEPNSVKNNAYIESFVIHARILITFLYDMPDSRDTILAANYLESWNETLSKTDLLLNVKERANKMAAHLTREGLKKYDADEEYKEWDRIKIRDEINKKLREFLDTVPEEAISRETKLAIRNVMRESAYTGPSCACFDANKNTTVGVTGPRQ